ncbi:MAG: copper amine oxidase N-terminal domain-containing protein [Clostridia bacterium]|nr:copper amine oxidase N-terminal domain-containing protein [Clostridia bacterium]
MKRKVLCLLLAAAICFSFALLPAGAAGTAPASAELVFQTGNDKAYINGVETDLVEAPRIIDGRTMVPFRILTESLNCTVEWISEGQKIIVTKNDDPSFKLKYQIGNSAIYREVNYIDELAYRMDTAPVLSEKGNTLLPARYVAELLGYTVNWADTYNATLIYKTASPMQLSDIKAKIAGLLKPIDASVTADSFYIDEERFAQNVYVALNDTLVQKGERSLTWSNDLSIVCNYRIYERQLMNVWRSDNMDTLSYGEDRRAMFEKLGVQYFVKEKEICLDRSSNPTWIIQNATHDESLWSTLKDTDYTQVAVSSCKDGDSYRTLLIIAGPARMK